jgi:NADPH-dependent glutamate synthase beta subunit-like oxidoreductase
MIIIQEGITNFDKAVIESARQQVTREIKGIYERNNKIVPNETKTPKFYSCLLAGTLKGVYEFLEQTEEFPDISSIRKEILRLEKISENLVRRL